MCSIPQAGYSNNYFQLCYISCVTLYICIMCTPPLEMYNVHSLLLQLYVKVWKFYILMFFTVDLIYVFCISPE